jgi:uncharacterized membrane protein YfcA
MNCIGISVFLGREEPLPKVVHSLFTEACQECAQTNRFEVHVSGALLIWVAFAVGVASFAQSLAGFGFALLCVPIMTVFVPPHEAVVISTAIGAVSTTIQAYTDRANTDWVMARRLIMSSFLGMPLGLAAFVFVSESVMRIVLGVVVSLAAFLLWKGFRLKEETRIVDWGLGIISGALSTSLSTNGPPIVFVMQARQFPPTIFRATINTVFSIVGLVSLALFVGTGKVEAKSINGILVALPVLAVSLSIGFRIRPHVHGERFRRLVLFLLLLSGLSAIVAAITH